MELWGKTINLDFKPSIKMKMNYNFKRLFVSLQT